MRLLTVGSLPPEWGGPVRGGAATFHAALLTKLCQRESVEVAGVLPPGPLDREIPVPAWIRPEGVSRARFYEDLLERLQPDVVLMNHFAHTIGVTHARLGAPVPAVGVAQSWHAVTFAEDDEGRRRAWETTQEALHGLCAVVSISRHAMVEGKQLGLEYPPVAEAIHNPVPPVHLTDVEIGAGNRAGVVFLGSLIERKAPGALVEAAVLLPEVDVSLVGQGDLENSLCAQIAQLGLMDRVRVAKQPVGEQHLAWVRRELLGAEVMCLPSRSETLGVAYVEALACGTPIVGFGPAVREIRDEVGFEVGEPLDSSAPEEIAAALERVLAAAWDRPRLRRAALAAFGLDRTADRYVELLSRVSTSVESV